MDLISSLLCQLGIRENWNMCNPDNHAWEDTYDIFGVPRFVFWRGKAIDPMDKLTDTVRQKGGIIADYFFRHGFGDIDANSDYMLVHMNPLINTTGIFYGKPVYEFASLQICQLIMAKHEISILSEARNVFNAGVASETYGGVAIPVTCSKKIVC